MQRCSEWTHWVRNPLILEGSKNVCEMAKRYLKRCSTSFIYPSLFMLSHVQLFATPWTVTRQAPTSLESSRQEYWSGLPFPPPRDLPSSGIEPASFPFAGGFFTNWATYKAQLIVTEIQIKMVRMAIIKKLTNNKCWRGCGEKGNSLALWWECKCIQPF